MPGSAHIHIQKYLEPCHTQQAACQEAHEFMPESTEAAASGQRAARTQQNPGRAQPAAMHWCIVAGRARPAAIRVRMAAGPAGTIRWCIASGTNTGERGQNAAAMAHARPAAVHCCIAACDLQVWPAHVAVFQNAVVFQNAMSVFSERDCVLERHCVLERGERRERSCMPANPERVFLLN